MIGRSPPFQVLLMPLLFPIWLTGWLITLHHQFLRPHVAMKLSPLALVCYSSNMPGLHPEVNKHPQEWGRSDELSTAGLFSHISLVGSFTSKGWWMSPAETLLQGTVAPWGLSLQKFSLFLLSERAAEWLHRPWWAAWTTPVTVKPN